MDVGGVQTSHYLLPTWKVLREWLLPQLRLTESFISIPTMPPLFPFFLFLLLLPRDSSPPLLYLNLLSTDRKSVRINNAAPQVFCLWGLESETSAECETPGKNTKWGPHVRSYFIFDASLLLTGSSLIRDSSVLTTMKGLFSCAHGLTSQRPCGCSDLVSSFWSLHCSRLSFPFGPFFPYFLPLCSSALPCPSHSSLRFSSWWRRVTDSHRN